MKKIIKKVKMIIFILLIAEITLLSCDTFMYCKYKYARLNINGRIICWIDKKVNFSGMASQ